MRGWGVNTMKTVILAGGRGTRLGNHTRMVPKPMVEIGGLPILYHIMNLYSCQHFDEFLIALGYRGDVIRQYFNEVHLIHDEDTFDPGRGQTISSVSASPDWRVHLVDTGLETQTGGRIKRLAEWLRHESCFMMTYGDGLADIDLRALLSFHYSHGRLATVTAVRPVERFGRLTSQSGLVTYFDEKGIQEDVFINGGFFVLHPGVLDYIEGDETVWEQEPLQRLVAEKQLMCYQHNGFWQCMDTPAERVFLEELWATGQAPWKLNGRVSA